MEQVFDNVKQRNAGFIRAFESAPNGALEKFAATAEDSILKRRLREDSFVDAILPMKDYSRDNSVFAKSENREDPYIIFEMEADQFMPKGPMSFNDTGDIREIQGNKFTLGFVKYTTPTFTKNIDFLRTWEGDIPQMVEDNCVRDLNRQKDFTFIAGVDAIAGAPGSRRNVYYPGRLTKASHAHSTQILPDRSLPVGVFLCNRRTANEVLLWDDGVIDRGANDMTEKLTFKGLGAFDTFEIHGCKYIVTMKNDIVPNGTVYQFSTPDYLGKAGFLQGMKMYVEKKEDFIRWHATEKLGFVIANKDAIQKVTWVGAALSNGNDDRLTSVEAAAAANAIAQDQAWSRPTA